MTIVLLSPQKNSITTQYLPIPCKEGLDLMLYTTPTTLKYIFLYRKILYSSIYQKDNKIQLPKSKVLTVNLTLHQSIFKICLRKEMWYFISTRILFATINRNRFLPKTHQSLTVIISSFNNFTI